MKKIVFNSTEDLIAYVKDKARMKTKVFSKCFGSGSLLTMYKMSLKIVKDEIQKGINDGSIVILNNDESARTLKKRVK